MASVTPLSPMSPVAFSLSMTNTLTNALELPPWKEDALGICSYNPHLNKIVSLYCEEITELSCDLLVMPVAGRSNSKWKAAPYQCLHYGMPPRLSSFAFCNVIVSHCLFIDWYFVIHTHMSVQFKQLNYFHLQRLSIVCWRQEAMDCLMIYVFLISAS